MIALRSMNFLIWIIPMTVHHRNLQKLATEMYKIQNNLSPVPMQEIFKKHTHDLRNNRSWDISKVRTVHYGTETIRYRGPKTWEMLPQNIKESKTLLGFKNKIKIWKPNDCTCRLCKTYRHNLGFLECLNIKIKIFSFSNNKQVWLRVS